MSNANITTRPHVPVLTLTSARESRDATLLPRTTRELAMLVERQTQQVDALLRALATERELAASARASQSETHAKAPSSPVVASAEPTPPRPTIPARRRILEALAVCNGGKPGKLTTVELQQALGLTKSEVWHAYAGKMTRDGTTNLVDSGDVVVLRGRKGGPDVLVHRDAIVVA